MSGLAGEATAPLDGGEEPLSVVGVGASAGGLAATVELLRHLGDKPGLAVIVLHHLDPTHDSALVELLAKITPLPVVAIQNGARVEINHVYVLPPNTALEISGGELVLVPRDDRGGTPMPIDRFFETLAVDRSIRAVGVVLTGTGADGTKGIKAIKAEGGVTFAQDGSAEHREMPSNAIATSCVDFVLPPSEIAQALRRIGERGLHPVAADEGATFARILGVLRRSSGIDFASYKHSTLRRRVQRRVVVSGLGTLAEYASLVERDAEEARMLGDEVLIHVTSFFRDPETFAALTTTVFPRIVGHRGANECIRIWVPGCSTGEEVYSVAISLLEFLAEAGIGNHPIKLFGTDVSGAAIDRARSGRYPASIEHEVSAARLERYFSRRDGGYQIRTSVRDLCIFATHDATRDPPFAGMDLISCRNLMIYLGTTLQDRILPIFHYALVEAGILVLGTSETVRAFPGFAALDGKNRIYARSSAAPRRLFDFADRRGKNGGIEDVAVSARSASALDVAREADRAVLAHSAPPGVVVTDDLAVVQFRGRTGIFLQPTPGTANLDLLRMVRDDLRLALRQTIEEARAKDTVATASVPVASDRIPARIEIEVIPFRVATSGQRFFVVLFREAVVLAAGTPVTAIEISGSAESQLREELSSTRSYLQSAVEQLEASNEELKSANEEIVSSNEELRSTNEELQMAKEELQATNEELRTINDEMMVRNVDATRLGDDLANVLNSVEIPIVLLGRDSRVRRFTTAAVKAFRLIASDVGRPLSDIRALVPTSVLNEMIGEVLDHLSAVSRVVQDDEGHWHQLTVRPYQTIDNRIDGTVVVALDIDTAKRASLLVAEARRYAESVVDSVRDCLFVIDDERRVRSANHAFYRMFGVSAKDVEGRPLDEIAHGAWNIPALHARLDQLGDAQSFDDLRIERDFAYAGWRALRLSARRIEGSSSILVAIEDVTERERTAKALATTERGFLDMLATIGEAIFMTDQAGKIVFANHMAHTMFGYAAGELVNHSARDLVPPRESPLIEDATSAGPQHERSPRRETSGLRADGSRFPIHAVAGSMRREGDLLRMSFVSDLTRQHEAETARDGYRTKLQQMAFDATLTEQRERRKIAADLHDRIGQSLALSQMKLATVRNATDGVTRASVDEAIALLKQSIDDTRELTFELSPPVLYELGLKDALGWLAEDIEKRLGLRTRLDLGESAWSLDEAIATVVFRAVRELLVNVSKHASSADARVVARLERRVLEVDVEDDGVGFDSTNGPLSSWAGFGLFSVREQFERIRGSVEIFSKPGDGSRIRLRVPIEPTSSPHPGGTS